MIFVKVSAFWFSVEKVSKGTPIWGVKTFGHGGGHTKSAFLQNAEVVV